MTPAFSRIPKQGDKVKGGPQVGGSGMPPFRSRVSENKGTKSKVAPQGGRPLGSGRQLPPQLIVGRRPRGWGGGGGGRGGAWEGGVKEGRMGGGSRRGLGGGLRDGRLGGSGGANWGGGSRWGDLGWGGGGHNLPLRPLGGGPQKGGSATSPLRSRGCPKQADKVKGGPQVGGSGMPPLRSPGSPAQGDGNKSGPQKGGNATSRLRSQGSPNKGTKSKVAHKWAEVLSKPYVLGCPQKGVQNWPAPGSSKKSHTGGSLRAVLNTKQILVLKDHPVATSPLPSQGPE